MKTLVLAAAAVMFVLVLLPAAYEWFDISLDVTAREVDRHGLRSMIISLMPAVKGQS